MQTSELISSLNLDAFFNINTLANQYTQIDMDWWKVYNWRKILGALIPTMSVNLTACWCKKLTIILKILKSENLNNSEHVCTRQINITAIFFFFDFLLDRGPFCGATGTLCFGLGMTLPMSFKVRMDQSLPMFFCHLHAMIPKVISGCPDRASNPDRSPQRRTRYHGTNSQGLVISIAIKLDKTLNFCPYISKHDKLEHPNIGIFVRTYQFGCTDSIGWYRV